MKTTILDKMVFFNPRKISDPPCYVYRGVPPELAYWVVTKLGASVIGTNQEDVSAISIGDNFRPPKTFSEVIYFFYFVSNFFSEHIFRTEKFL